MAQKKQQPQVQFKNRKAEFEYFLSTKFTAGIVLVGTEIKAIRTGKVNLTDSYCLFIGEEFWNTRQAATTTMSQSVTANFCSPSANCGRSGQN